VPKTLKVQLSNWTRVFRRIIEQLECDPEIRRVVGTDHLRSWKGVPGDRAPLSPSSGSPIIRLTPNPGDVDWYSPDTQAGLLAVRVELAVQSLCIDDVADLWDLIVSALSPESNTLCADLRTAGAETGEIVFNAPAFDPQPSAEPEGQFFAIGRFQLRVLRLINP
jgi:hypothetical protein